MLIGPTSLAGLTGLTGFSGSSVSDDCESTGIKDRPAHIDLCSQIDLIVSRKVISGVIRIAVFDHLERDLLRKSPFEAALEENDAEKIEEAYRNASKKFDMAASKGVIHKNAANRKKSQLAKKKNA